MGHHILLYSHLVKSVLWLSMTYYIKKSPFLAPFILFTRVTISYTISPLPPF